MGKVPFAASLIRQSVNGIVTFRAFHFTHYYVNMCLYVLLWQRSFPTVEANTVHVPLFIRLTTNPRYEKVNIVLNIPFAFLDDAAAVVTLVKFRRSS